MKRNSEDLKEFAVDANTISYSGDGNFFGVRCDGERIALSGRDYGASYEVEDVVLIHQKLGQLIATAQRKQNK